MWPSTLLTGCTISFCRIRIGSPQLRGPSQVREDGCLELQEQAECRGNLEGIRAYTVNAGYASFEEKIKGSIEPGKLADFVVLSENPCEVDPWEIRNIKVERTIIGGETVFQAE